MVLQVSDPAGLERARAAVSGELDQIDLACSRFRSDSELSRVNAGSGRIQPIGGLLAEAIELSLRAARLTDGDVDPTVGQSLLTAGYDRDWTLMPRASQGRTPASAKAHDASVTVSLGRVPGWRAVQLDRRRQTIRIPRGTTLDLGAVAKAWAADRAALAASTAAGCGALVAVGGDVAVSGTARGREWLLRVADHHRRASTREGQNIRILSGGLATSSTAVRRWMHHGREVHHIIDPSTGSPACSPWRTVSVAAASCADANIAATAALVRGERAVAWLTELRLPSRLVDEKGAVVYVAGWPCAQGRDQC